MYKHVKYLKIELIKTFAKNISKNYARMNMDIHKCAVPVCGGVSKFEGSAQKNVLNVRAHDCDLAIFFY